eukprot:264456-Chlamydomonas_euryale.AAC.6
MHHMSWRALLGRLGGGGGVSRVCRGRKKGGKGGRLTSGGEEREERRGEQHQVCATRVRQHGGAHGACAVAAREFGMNDIRTRQSRAAVVVIGARTAAKIRPGQWRWRARLWRPSQSRSTGPSFKGSTARAVTSSVCTWTEAAQRCPRSCRCGCGGVDAVVSAGAWTLLATTPSPCPPPPATPSPRCCNAAASRGFGVAVGMVGMVETASRGTVSVERMGRRGPHARVAQQDQREFMLS